MINYSHVLSKSLGGHLTWLLGQDRAPPPPFMKRRGDDNLKLLPWQMTYIFDISSTPLTPTIVHSSAWVDQMGEFSWGDGFSLVTPKKP